MSELVDRLREDAEMLKDGYQQNLTEAWHTVAMKHAANDADQAADALEAKDKLISELVEALETAMAFIDSNVADPDLTHEMWAHYRKLDHLEPHELLSKAKTNGINE